MTSAEFGVVIAVAPNAEQRLRIADAVGDTAPVLLVATVNEAMALLAGSALDPLAEEEQHPTPQMYPAGIVVPTERFPGDNLVIDSDARLAVCGDREVELSPLEHDLLLTLQEAEGHIRTFDWVQRHVWHNDHQGGRAHVQSVVKRLRRKLRSISCPDHIETVRGVGLRLVGAAVDVPAARSPGDHS